MSIASRIEAIEQHLTDDYSVLTLAGADLTNVDKNIINLKPTWQERLLYFINNGTDVVWNNWEKVEGTGASLSLNSTEEAPMKIDLKGNTSQEGTPTPEAPQDIHVVSGDNSIDVCGKNLFDKDNANILNAYLNVDNGKITNSNANRTLYIPCNSNTTYTLTKYASPYVRQIGYTTELPANNVDFYGRVDILANETTGTITTGENAKYLVCRIMNTNQDTITQQKMLDSIQIEYGSTASTYEAYTGASYDIDLGTIELCKIGDYQDSIKKSTGKNLFDKNTITTTTGWLIEDGTISTNHPDYYVSDFIPIKPNTAYYKTKTDSSRTKFYDSNKQPLNTTTYQDISVGGNAGTFTTSNNAYYLRMTINTYLSSLDSIMLNEGSTALPYEPYGKVWYLNKQIGKVVLNGSEEWTKSTSTANDIFVLSNGLPTNVKSSDKSSSISNYFLYNQSTNITNRFYITNDSRTIAIVFTSYGTTTKEQFTTWLSSHSTSIYYPLATPTYTEITDTTLQQQLNALEKARSYNSQTNLTQTNNDISFIITATALESITNS